MEASRQIIGCLVTVPRLEPLINERCFEPSEPVVRCSQRLPREGACSLSTVGLNVRYSDTLPLHLDGSLLR